MFWVYLNVPMPINIIIEVTITSDVLPCIVFSLVSLDAELHKVKLKYCISLYYISTPRIIIKSLIIVN